MPIVSNDIKFYESGDNHGGTLTNTVAQDFNVMGSFTGAQTSAGETRYACVYLRNDSATNTALSMEVSLGAVTDFGTVSASIGLGSALKNQDETTVADKNTAPAGVSFIATGALAVGDLTVSQYKAVWLRLIVPAGTSPKNEFTIPLTVTLSTGE